MKTSQQTAVNEIIRKIQSINTDLRNLKDCTECSFRMPSGQFRIQITDNTPLYALMEATYGDALTTRKTNLISELKNKYNVEYDGD